VGRLRSGRSDGRRRAFKGDRLAQKANNLVDSVGIKPIPMIGQVLDTERSTDGLTMYSIGPFDLNNVATGDCLELIPRLPDECIDVVVTSPPYWGQRMSHGTGTEEDPREYLAFLRQVFSATRPKLKSTGIIWINIGDAYNTPVNWRQEDRQYSSLGADKNGLNENNSAYIKPRAKRRAFIERKTPWLTYGNLLALPYRLITAMCDDGFVFRGEVIWRKMNPMPEGRCRRPHRQHEPIYLLARNERHSFRAQPPVPSVWEFPNEKIQGESHYSRFPLELPRRCIEAYGSAGEEVLVFDPFTGSGTTGIAARKLGCNFVGFEIDPSHASAANKRLDAYDEGPMPLFTANGVTSKSR
jgi:DNA modification methylase